MPSIPPPWPPPAGAALGLGNVGYHGFRGEHQARDGGCVLQRRAGYLGGVDDAGLHQIFVDIRCGVVAVVRVLALVDFADNHRAFFAGVADDLAEGLFEGAADDLGTDLLVAFQGLDEGIDVIVVRTRATPPPGTMPSSTAARVACMASSTRAFFSFISVSVAAPTLMTATPPTSLARRSWSFSRS